MSKSEWMHLWQHQPCAASHLNPLQRVCLCLVLWCVYALICDEVAKDGERHPTKSKRPRRFQWGRRSLLRRQHQSPW